MEPLFDGETNTSNYIIAYIKKRFHKKLNRGVQL